MAKFELVQETELDGNTWYKINQDGIFVSGTLTRHLEEATKNLEAFANGKPSTPPLVGDDEIKAVQDYSFEIALLDQEAKTSLSNIQTYWEDIFRSQNAILGGMDIKKLAPMMNGVNPLSEQGAKDKDLINQLFGGDLEASTQRLKDRLESIKGGIKPSITAFTTDLGKWISKNFEVLKAITSEVVGGLADIFATGLGNMFNQDVEFDPKKMIAQVLESIGAMLIGIAAPLVAALALGNVATFGGMSVQWGAALGMLGAGIAMKGGGMAMSADSAGSTTGSSTTTNARSYSPYGGSNSMQTVKVQFANGALEGYMNYKDKKYNG